MGDTRDVSNLAAAIGIVGTVSSQLMNLSAIPSIIKIHRAKSTLLFPAYPFVFGFVAAILGIVYAVFTEQYIVLVSTGMSFTFNVVFLCVHFRYTSTRSRLFKIAIGYLGIVVVVAGSGPAIDCAVGENCRHFSTIWLGVVMTLVYSLVYCGQLTTFRDVVRRKNSASISPYLTAGVLFCASIWTLYSILVLDYFYLASSIVGVLSGLAQVVLILVYPAKWTFNHQQNVSVLRTDVVAGDNEIQAHTPDEIRETDDSSPSNRNTD